MSDTICNKCGLDLSGPEGEINLTRCTEADCPMQKRKKGKILLPIVLMMGSTALVLGGVSAGLAWISAPPDRTERDADTARRVAAMKEAEKARATAAAPVVIAKDGGTGLTEKEKPKALAAEAFKGPLPQPNPLAVARVTSFSCEGKASPGRAFVCSDPALAISDYNLSLLYKSVAASTGRRGEIQRTQAAWLARLDKLGTSKERVSALYRERFNELSLMQVGSKA